MAQIKTFSETRFVTRPAPLMIVASVAAAAFLHFSGTEVMPKLKREKHAPELASILIPPPPKPALKVDQTGLVMAYFDRIGFGFAPDQLNVPRALLPKMPQGLKEMKDVKARKALFFRIMLPLILTANEEISRDRAKLEAILAKTSPSKADEAWLTAQKERYRTKSDHPAQLLLAIDTIPVSLALAQSAEESGWGTSRFTRLGNALFGQWAYSDDAGIVPEGREHGQKHVIRAFDDLLGSVRAYMLNLNRHAAYAGLRQMRADARAKGSPVSGNELTATLLAYSERGEKYVHSLQAIIRINKLAGFDAAQLAKKDPEETPPDLSTEVAANDA